MHEYLTSQCLCHEEVGFWANNLADITEMKAVDMWHDPSKHNLIITGQLVISAGTSNVCSGLPVPAPQIQATI